MLDARDQDPLDTSKGKGRMLGTIWHGDKACFGVQRLLS